MLSHFGLDNWNWSDAITSACFLGNRSPSSTIKFKIPVEMWSNKSVRYTTRRCLDVQLRWTWTQIKGVVCRL